MVREVGARQVAGICGLGSPTSSCLGAGKVFWLALRRGHPGEMTAINQAAGFAHRMNPAEGRQAVLNANASINRDYEVMNAAVHIGALTAVLRCILVSLDTDGLMILLGRPPLLTNFLRYRLARG